MICLLKSYGPDRTFKLYSYIPQHLHQDVFGKLSILNLIYKKKTFIITPIFHYLCVQTSPGMDLTLSPQGTHKVLFPCLVAYHLPGPVLQAAGLEATALI